MAKPKHPTPKSLRQGQTVYCVQHFPLINYDDCVRTFFLRSQNEQTPLMGKNIDKIPVDFLRDRSPSGRLKGFYYSRRIAERIAREQNSAKRYKV